MLRPAAIVVINLEKDCLSLRLECTEVVFFMGIVGATEIVVDGDCLGNAADGVWAEGGDPRRNDDEAS
jgi:hypothetical protein